MSTRIISRAILFVALLFLQIAIFNHIHLLGYITPYLIVYYLVLAPSDTNHSLLLAENFLMGLCLDISTNTPGMAAGALTFTAFLSPHILKKLCKTDRPDETLTPSASKLGWSDFMTYAAIVTLIFLTTYNLIAWFSISHLQHIMLNVAGSTMATLLIIYIAERIHSRL